MNNNSDTDGQWCIISNYWDIVQYKYNTDILSINIEFMYFNYVGIWKKS